MSSFKNVILHLMQSLKFFEKNKEFVCNKGKYLKIEPILKYLLKYGVLYSFRLINDKIILKINHKKLYEVKYFSETKYLSSYKIRSIVARFPDSIYIISTHLGIIDSVMAVKHNIGGQLLFVIKLPYSHIKSLS